jgi:hypothetical protein
MSSVIETKNESENRSGIFLKLANKFKQLVPAALLVDYKNKFRQHENPRYWSIVDFNQCSSEKRLYVFDTDQEKVECYYVSHGRGSEGAKDDGFAEIFSNVSGSNCSSLGIYLCAELYDGKHGLSMRLDGLESTNSNVRARSIVMHGADYVSDDFIQKNRRIGRSEGCFAVENAVIRQLVNELKNGSLLIAWKNPTATLNVNDLIDGDIKMSIIDTHRNTTSKIACLRTKGVQTVIRYYNFSNSLQLPEKRMELAEAQALGASDIQIAVVFQQGQNKAADFSKLKGIAAGRRAYRYAHDNIGQPADSAIYFSVDFDADAAEIDNNIAPYFEGVKEAFAQESGGEHEYRIGAYGSGLTCSKLTEKGLIEFTWLAMSRGFRGTKAALTSGNYHLTQLYPSAVLCGLDVDFNDANPAHPDFGAFTIKDDTQPHNNVIDTTVGERYKVIARSGLRLRSGAGTQFDVIGSLLAGQIIFVAKINNGWARVDVEGDGQIDGFASADFLERV